MRIAAFHPFLVYARGAELAFARVVEELAQRGHSVFVASLGMTAEFVNRFKAAGIRSWTGSLPGPREDFLFYGARWMGLDRVYYGRHLRRAADAMSRDAPDACLVHHFFLAPRLIPLLPRPVVFYCPEPPRAAYEDDLWNRNRSEHRRRLVYKRFVHRMASGARLSTLGRAEWLMRGRDRREFESFARQADWLVANSEYSRRVLRRILGRDALVAYPGVDVDRFTPLDSARNRNVLSVGPLWPAIKGHEFVIRSIARIPTPKRPPLLVIGSGRPWDEAYLRDLAASEHVVLTQRRIFSSEELLEAFRRCGVVAVGYHKEPFGLVAAEALSCEAPVVAVDEGALPEIVAPGTGHVIPRDEWAFAAAVQDCLDNPQQSVEMARAGRCRVLERFTWSRCVDVIEAALAQRA